MKRDCGIDLVEQLLQSVCEHLRGYLGLGFPLELAVQRMAEGGTGSVLISLT